MYLIKLSATDSTNACLKRLSTVEHLPDLSVVWALHQTEGRGQPGKKWQSEAGKNLTFSMLKRFESLPASRQFLINIWASLAVCQVLSGHQVPDLRIKWPNDILSGNRKLCGILPENSLKGGRIVQTILGIGLNVNQTKFEGLPGAASVKGVTGQAQGLEPLLLEIREAFSREVSAPGAFDYARQQSRYEALLFRKGEASGFIRDGMPFVATLRGIDRDGRLVLEEHKGSLGTYGFGEIQMQY